MEGNPVPLARSIAILDGRPEDARMLASLAAEDHHSISIELFRCPDAAQQWIEAAPSTVVVLVDIAASNGLFIERAMQWRARMGVVLVAMLDQGTDEDVERAGALVVDATFAKPSCKDTWARSFGSFLRAALLPDRLALLDSSV